MELVILLILLAAVVLYVMIRGAIEEKKSKQKYREKLRSDFAKFPDKEYKKEEWDSIPGLYKHKNNSGTVDDITWNDLGMDQIYKLINRTQSSSGAEYLYDMLRTPRLNGKDIDRLEKDIQYVSENEEERVDIQMCLHELGSTGKYSLFDYIDYLQTLGKRSNTKHIVCVIALLVSLAVIFISTTLGVALLIGVACYNVVTYMKEKKSLLPYVTTFSYIMRMLDCAEGILTHKLTDMSVYRDSLSVKVSATEELKKRSVKILRMNASTGNPIEIIFEYVKMLTHFDIMHFNRTFNMVHDNRDNIVGLVDDIGYIDAIISIAGFRQSLSTYCVPTLNEGNEIDFKIKDGYHPSLKNPVPNSFEQKRGMLLTGSNASGKSTFLKMVAINAILAQTIHTCAASEYTGGYFRIYSSMSLRDNLDDGESYYIVEIKALKRIVDVADSKTDNPLLCFVDEVLRGTNTVERIAASTEIMKRLSEDGIYCFAATHDIELTHLLEKYYDNYHFEEEVKDGDVLFSYHLLSGRAHTRNAIRLLEVIGFSEEIIKSADDLAGDFLKTGEWNAERQGN